MRRANSCRRKRMRVYVCVYGNSDPEQRKANNDYRSPCETDLASIVRMCVRRFGMDSTMGRWRDRKTCWMRTKWYWLIVIIFMPAFHLLNNKRIIFRRGSNFRKLSIGKLIDGVNSRCRRVLFALVSKSLLFSSLLSSKPCDWCIGFDKPMFVSTDRDFFTEHCNQALIPSPELSTFDMRFICPI